MRHLSPRRISYITLGQPGGAAAALPEVDGTPGRGLNGSAGLNATGAGGGNSSAGDAVARRSSLAQLGEGGVALEAGLEAEAEAGPDPRGSRGDPERAEAVRRAMLHAWRSYERFAMGAAELHPVSKTAKQDILGGAGEESESVARSRTFTGGRAGRGTLLGRQSC